LTRVINLGNTPALNSDEAALGYNAYSLLHTGKDEHGVAWPLHFKSFGDYKPGGYVYLAMPFVKVLGLTPLAVRLPNLIFSLLTIYILYKLILLLTLDFRFSLLSAFVLAISPWHIHFSRGAWESSVALSFIIIGTYFFFKSIKNKFLLNFTIFVVFYVLSMYLYHSARIIAPLLALSLIVLYFKNLIKRIPQIFIPIIIGFMLTLPVLLSFINNGGTQRFSGVGLTADQGPVNRANELLNNHSNMNTFIRIIHNKRILYLISWAQKYTSHFEFNFLAINGDEVPRSKSPEMGQIHLIEVSLLILGIIFLLKDKTIFKSKKSKIFIFFWLFISPLASSLTFQAPSALRALPMVIPLAIFIAFTLNTFIVWTFKSRYWKLLVSCLLIIGYIFSALYYLDSYFYHYAKRYPFAWQYGFNEVISYLEKNQNKYKFVYVTDKYDQPYILFLFYLKYSPQLIQKETQLTPPDQFGFSTVKKFDRYHFEKLNWDNIPPKTLIIASDEMMPVEPLDIINFPNGQPGFKIYQKL
jgi:4-amino-4-deoxy-L-arabinose transferase-like glycosyltransferase